MRHSFARIPGVLVLLASFAAGACSLVTDLSGLHSDPPRDADGGAALDGPSSVDGYQVDGGGGADAPFDVAVPTDAGTDGPRVVFSSTFDVDCELWTGPGLTPVAEGRNGGGCQFCPGNSGGQMFHFPPDTPVSGTGTYTYTVWVQSSVASASGGIGMYVKQEDGGGSTAAVEYNKVTSGTSWTLWKVGNPTEPGTEPATAQLDVSLNVNDAGICFIVDDISLVVTP
jgi:hypothetical protein